MSVKRKMPKSPADRRGGEGGGDGERGKAAWGRGFRVEGVKGLVFRV